MNRFFSNSNHGSNPHYRPVQCVPCVKGVVPRGAMAPSDFDISVNPISTKGGRLCPPPDFQTFLRPWCVQCAKCLPWESGHQLKSPAPPFPISKHQICNELMTSNNDSCLVFLFASNGNFAKNMDFVRSHFLQNPYFRESKLTKNAEITHFCENNISFSSSNTQF